MNFSTLTRRLPARSLGALLLACAALSACGGGGDSAAAAATGSSSGSSGSTSTSAAKVGDANAVAVFVDSGVAGRTGGAIPNAIYANVKICAPGSTSNCAIVDHVLVDTGSVGLRLVASAIPSAVLSALPASSASSSVGGECIAFASGSTWGAVRQADLRLGGAAYEGETASNLTVQIVADPDPRLASIPASCSNQGSLMQTANDLGANGILGVGLFQQDCGASCASSALSVYYDCPSAGACVATAMPLAKQVSNPISSFAADSNGSIISFPALSGTGAARLDGVMIFGIGTRSNNALPAGSQTLGADSSGYFTATLNGRTLPSSFIDSGSSVNFFPAAGLVSIPTCASPNASFFCPSASLTLSSLNAGRSATSSTASVLVNNAAVEFNASPSAYAYPGLSGPSVAPYDSLDLGASFFFGRSVSTLIENSSATGFSVAGPAFAHTP